MPVSGRSRLSILVASLAFLGTFAITATKPAPAAAAGPIKLGAYIANPGVTAAPENGPLLDSFSSMVGRQPDIVMDYRNLTEPLLNSVQISNLQARGASAMVTWQLFQSGYSGPTIPLQAIAAGDYDSYLRQAAQLARGLPFPIMIRFAHEMNGDWYGWSGQPSAYVDAWRHIVTVFRNEGAANVEWVWSPNVDNGGSYPFVQYFPGDSWVDYVALDGYNWGTAGVGVNKWQSLSTVFSSSYNTLTQISAKPVMIAETSSSEVGGDKAAWIRDGFLQTIPQQFPRIEAVIWFDRVMEQDWRVDSSTGSLGGYRCVVDSPIYGGPGAMSAAKCPVSKKKKRSAVRSLRVTPRVHVSPAAVASRRASGASLRGSVSYRLSRRAGVRITVRSRSGRRFTLTRTSSRRRGAVRLAKVVGRQRLRRGRYSVIATAIDDSGQASKPRRAGFRAV